MDLKDLLAKPASECSDEELEKQAHLLSKLRVVPEKKKTTAKTKSNSDKRIEDLISKMPKEQLQAMLLKLKQEAQ